MKYIMLMNSDMSLALLRNHWRKGYTSHLAHTQIGTQLRHMSSGWRGLDTALLKYWILVPRDSVTV